MNTLTNHQVAKVFAMYIGCKMTKSFDPPDGIAVNGTSIETISNGGLKQFKLLLRPLSAITDEELHRLAFVAHFVPQWIGEDNVIKESEVIIGEIVRFEDKIEIETSCRCFSGTVILDKHGNLAMKDSDDPMWGAIANQVECTDYLRENGFMLPYKGIDLFEAGLAIDSTLAP